MAALKLIAGALACSLMFAGNAQAQGYPNKPIRMLVPFAAGGPTDIIARLVGQKLSETLGQQFVVENVGGAGGNIGTAMAAKSPADGYTVLVVSTGFVINPSLYAKVPYDVVKDFAPVTLVAASPNILTVNPSVPAKSVKELIEVIKSSPGKYSFAQPATGSTPHLAGELFKLTYNLDMVMVPFTGAALAVNSTIGGHTPIAFTALPPTISNVKDGKLRGLAILASKRSPTLPDVPTMAEAGIPDQESDTLTGIVVPIDTPKEMVNLLQREVAKVVALPDIKEKLATLGFDPIANTPDEFGVRIKSEMAKWAKVVHAANLKIE